MRSRPYAMSSASTGASPSATACGFRGSRGVILGTSLRSGRPVVQDLWETGWRTVLLTGSAMVLTLLFASVTAYLVATDRHPGWASGLTVTGYVLSGLPVYWLGYVVIYVATTRFGIFPVMSGTETKDALGAVHRPRRRSRARQRHRLRGDPAPAHPSRRCSGRRLHPHRPSQRCPAVASYI